MIFKNFKQFLCDFIKNSMNYQLHHAQLHQNTKQKPQQNIQAFASYLKNLKAHISLITEKHHYNTLFIKLQLKLKVAFINFQTLPDIFKSLIALSVRLKQNQQQLFSSITSIKHNQSENGVKRANTGQQLKKPKSEKISASDQHRKQTDNKSKKDVICYQCNKKSHYKLQCFKLAKKQLKNTNQAPVREMHIKENDQYPQKTS